MLELAILGVLKEQPMHGYELRHYLSFILGHIWQLSYGTLYPALRRLEKRGEIFKQTIRDGRGPARHVYALTPQGEKTFLEQMATVGSSTEISDSNKFNLRLIFFRYLDSEKRQALLAERLGFLEGNRKSLAEMEAMPSSALDSFRRELIRFHAQAALDEIAFLKHLLASEQDGRTPTNEPRREVGA